jgi:putative ABC transport system substrate-binding protein
VRRPAPAPAWLAIAAVVLAMVPRPVAAQASKMPHIGFLSPHDGSASVWVRGFGEGLKELGYVEGQNIKVEYRWAHGRFDRLPELAAELVRLDVDAIVAVVTAASLAAKAATPTIPIVMAGVADPVGVGLIASLARPGGNVTGTSAMSAEIVGKQFELLKETDPGLGRAAVLWNPANVAFQTLQLKESEAAGRRSGVQLLSFEARGPGDFDGAFAAMRRDGIRALHILSDPLFVLHREALVGLGSKNRLVAVSGFREFAEAGGLMSYAPSYFDASKRAVAYVDKILKGAKPADLPVEQPTRFDLVVNLKTAKALGITVPQSILLRADEVIE